MSGVELLVMLFGLLFFGLLAIWATCLIGWLIRAKRFGLFEPGDPLTDDDLKLADVE